jgi:peptide/nickel transport system permease protein
MTAVNVEAGVLPRPRFSLTGRTVLGRRLPWSVIIPGSFIAVLVFAAVFAPVVAPANPLKGSVSERLRGVGSPGHLLGTDALGRDLLSRLIWGARPSLLEGVVPVAIAGTIGTFLGTVAGLRGHRTHSGIMRSLDVLYSFPAILLAIALSASLGAGVVNAIVALSIVLIAPIARVADTEVARMRSSDYMEAARASGAPSRGIVIRHVMPIIAPVLIVYCTALVGLAVVFAGGLSFLGLGVAPPQPEWGSMLNDLTQDLYNAPLLTLMPAFIIFLTAMAFNLLGDGLRDLLDIRSENLT